VSIRSALRRSPAALVIVLPALLLAACGGSGAGLIPTADAGPLEHDFEEVARLAREGNGSCIATTDAIEHTEADFAKLSASIDATLRGKLQEGITNLRHQALEQCAQVATTTTTTTKTHTAEPLVVSTTQSSSATSSAAPNNSGSHGEEESNNGGGTQAPGEGNNPGGAEAGGGGAGGGGNENGEAFGGGAYGR
jgi:hypothetical protein